MDIPGETEVEVEGLVVRKRFGTNENKGRGAVAHKVLTSEQNMEFDF